MKHSVVVCTYNGRPFLDEQLQSLCSQTAQADEVVICDDGSSDGTYSILQDWAERQPEISLFRNERNVGGTANFATAIAKAHGNILFCCDQDDIWEPSKLDVARSVFETNPDVGYVFSDATRIDKRGECLPFSLWQSLPVPFTELKQTRFADDGGFSQLLRMNVVTGCTMAFRSEFKSLILPIPDGWVHDAWIAICISAVSSGLPLKQKLMRYRQHGAQQIGERRRGWLSQYRVAARMGRERFNNELSAHRALLERLAGQSEWPVAEEKLTLLREKIRFLEDRVRMRDRLFRSPLVLRNVWRKSYGRFAYGWKSVLQDLLIRH